MIISKYNKKDQNLNISPKTLFDLKNRLMKTNLLELSSSTDYQKLPEFYFNHRYNFSIPLELNCPECDETEIKNKISAYVQDAIFNPFASITAQELKYDPYLATRTILNNLSPQFRYKFDDEFMYIETGDMERHYIFNLKLKKSILIVHSANIMIMTGMLMMVMVGMNMKSAKKAMNYSPKNVKTLKNYNKIKVVVK